MNSVWKQNSHLPEFSRLTHDISCDVLIIGGRQGFGQSGKRGRKILALDIRSCRAECELCGTQDQ